MGSHLHSDGSKRWQFSSSSMDLPHLSLPVWLLLAPRDYLSTLRETWHNFSVGSRHRSAPPVLAHAAADPLCRWHRAPVCRNQSFPFAFITIACGAVSGFHSLISSGNHSQADSANEPETRMVGYGGMMAESMVAIMAMIAASVLQTGV